MKKIFSKAVASVFLDKNARKTMKTAKSGKPGKDAGPAKKPVTAKADARPDAVEPAPAKPRAAPRAKAQDDLVPLPADVHMTPERERLIRMALQVQKTQSKLLDGVDPELKERVSRLLTEQMEAANKKKH